MCAARRSARPRRRRPGTRVDRRVSNRGSIVIAGQKIHIGIGHAGQTVTVEDADATFRVPDGDHLLAEVIHTTTTKAIARFKARKPDPARRSRISSVDHHNHIPKVRS